MASTISERIATRNPMAAKLCFSEFVDCQPSDLRGAVVALSYFYMHGRYTQAGRNRLMGYMEHTYAAPMPTYVGLRSGVVYAAWSRRSPFQKPLTMSPCGASVGACSRR